MQFELLGGGVQVRPNPCPSFSNCLATAGAYGLESVSLFTEGALLFRTGQQSESGFVSVISMGLYFSIFPTN
jgi:hypothetical protein